MLDRHQQGRVDDERMLPRDIRLTKRTRIPNAYHDTGLEQYVLDDGNREAWTAVAAWTRDFWDTKGHGGRGILLLGPPGRGKTMLACMAATSLSDDGAMVRFLTLAGYAAMLIRQMKLESAWEKHDDASAYEEWRETDLWIQDTINTAHLVVLDDVGKEHRTRTGFAEDEFDLFLRTRVALGRPTIMTSNVGMSQWGEQYSEAMQSFVHEAADVITITKSTDRRKTA